MTCESGSGCAVHLRRPAFTGVVQATALAPESPDAWARYAHALARTDRFSDCLAACEKALQLAPDPEVRDLLERVRAAAPRELTEAA